MGIKLKIISWWIEPGFEMPQYMAEVTSFNFIDRSIVLRMKGRIILLLHAEHKHTQSKIQVLTLAQSFIIINLTFNLIWNG